MKWLSMCSQITKFSFRRCIVNGRKLQVLSVLSCAFYCITPKNSLRRQVVQWIPGSGGVHYNTDRKIIKDTKNDHTQVKWQNQTKMFSQVGTTSTCPLPTADTVLQKIPDAWNRSFHNKCFKSPRNLNVLSMFVTPKCEMLIPYS